MRKRTVNISGGFILSIFLIALAACQKTDTPPSTPTPALSVVPALTFVSASPATVHQYKDSIIFTVNYADGDGDLGNANADSASLFLVDSRQNITESYHIPPLAPGTAKISITGTLRVKLDHTALLNGTTQETTTYTIYMTDRAGHKSNTVSSPVITVLP